MRVFATALLALAAVGAEDLHVSGDRLREHVKYLAADRLEGRGVGTNGEKLATEYIASQLKAAGVAPAGDHGSYFQRVPLVGSTTMSTATLSFHGTSLQFATDYVGTALSQKAQNDFDAEAVFVGHGISAPEFGWDDYKGQDVHGKVLIFFTNEPPSTDPKFFGGPALTYYGRWVYKFEEAARRGAVAALIIHTTPTAGYGWEVVRGSWSGENPELELKPGETGLKLAAWLSEDTGRKLVAGTGKSLDQLLALANEKSFRPIPLGIHIAGHIPVKLRRIESRNVLGRVDGVQPRRKPYSLPRTGTTSALACQSTATRSTTARSITPPDAQWFWKWRAFGPPCSRNHSAAPYSYSLLRKKPACLALDTTASIRPSPPARPPSI